MSHRRHATSPQFELQQTNNNTAFKAQSSTLDADDIIPSNNNSNNNNAIVSATKDDDSTTGSGGTAAGEKDEELLLDEEDESGETRATTSRLRDSKKSKAIWELIIEFFMNEYNRRVMIQVCSCFVLVPLFSLNLFF